MVREKAPCKLRRLEANHSGATQGCIKRACGRPLVLVAHWPHQQQAKTISYRGGGRVEDCGPREQGFDMLFAFS